MTRSTTLSCIAALLAASGLTLAAVGPRLTRRIRPDWTWSSSYIGYQTWADPGTGTLPDRDVTCLYGHDIAIVPGSLSADSVRLADRYVVHDVDTGAVVYEYLSSALVDPRTGERLEPEFAGGRFLFPRHARKTTYVLRMSYLEGLPMAFINEAVVQGLPTYHYGYRGRAEYTEAYAGTAEFPGFVVPAGHEIRCANDAFRFDAWVEPVSGEIVKIAEGCPTGDYVYAAGSDAPLMAVDRCAGEMAGDDVVARVRAARSERARQILVTRAPVVMLAGAAGFGILALLSGRRRGA